MKSENDPFLCGFYQAPKGLKNKDLCWVKGCCRAKKKPGSPMCHKHYQRWWRHRNPKRSSFNTLRDHAKGRGLEFSISFDYWCGLCDAFGYFNQDPESEEILTIDRVDACKGYAPGNLRVLSLSLNVIKGNRERHLPEHVQSMIERNRQMLQPVETESEDCPF